LLHPISGPFKTLADPAFWDTLGYRRVTQGTAIVFFRRDRVNP
jgi:hypothetical protein